MLTFGVVVLGVTDRQRAEDCWCAALGYRRRVLSAGLKDAINGV